MDIQYMEGVYKIMDKVKIFEKHFRSIYWNYTEVTTPMWVNAAEYDPTLTIGDVNKIIAKVITERYHFMLNKILLRHMPVNAGVLQLLYDKNLKCNILALNNNILIKHASLELDYYASEYGFIW